MGNREVLKARCRTCDKDHPLTLINKGVCLFCSQAEAHAAVAEELIENTPEPRSEEERHREAMRHARRQMRDKMEAAKKRDREKQSEEAEEAAQIEPGKAALQEAARRVLAKQHLLPFVKRFQPEYEAGWVHKDICEHLEWFSQAVANKESPRLAIFMPPRHGKQLADATPILTTKGWTTHGELKAGDLVFHPSGAPVEVLATSEKTASDWVVSLSNGESIRCHANHEWTVFDRAYGKWRTVSTEWFARKTKFGKTAQVLSKGRSTYQLPAVEALQFEEQTLPMDPYVLGAWLGDGSRTKPCITHDANDQAVISRIESAGYPISTVSTHKTTGVLTTSFAGPRPNVAGRMTQELGAMGLRVSSKEGYKRIPELYLRSSVEQRLELLAGLMDTDGHCDSNSRCRFTTADAELADGVMELCKTLGFRPYIEQVEPRLSTSGIQGQQWYYVVGFQPTMAIPCVLERKCPQRFAEQRRVGITAVRYEPNGEQGHCIQVDSPDGLYLAGRELNPTHNSELASRSFPAWHLGNHPEHEVIACSYSGALAMSFSRKVRAMLRDTSYQTVFEDTRLDPESQSAESWMTTKAGGYVAAGVGGAITGKGAHVLIIDDPVKNREEAESEGARETVWDWYTSTAYTRLAPGGGVLLILTRWHDDDLAGRLLSKALEEEGDQWHVIQYPAIAETDELYRKQGEALHPARYPLDALKRIKRAIGPRDWSALYQQNPVADDGDIFRKNMFRYYAQKDLPPYDEMHFYTCWDLALGQKEMNDFSVGVTIGVDRQDDVYVVDIQRGRWGSLELTDKILEVYRVWRSYMTGIERGQIEMSLEPLLNKRKRELGLTAFDWEPMKPGKSDKVARSRSIQGRMMQGRVLFRKNCDVTNTLVNEMLRFPNGVHDDQVDAISYVGKMLDQFVVPRAPRQKPKKSWKDKLPGMVRGKQRGYMAA